jgi:hypothetical protein
VPPLPPKEKLELPPVDDQFDIIARKLKNGDVVEFTENKVRARLMWVSQSRHSYLFLSPGAKHNLTHADVTNQMRAGKLRICDSTKGAVKGMVDRLEAALT